MIQTDNLKAAQISRLKTKIDTAAIIIIGLGLFTSAGFTDC